jgi:hypothetical protein
MARIYSFVYFFLVRSGSLKGRERAQGRGWLKQVSADNPVTVPSSENTSLAG